jgi:cell division septation protein DedD
MPAERLHHRLDLSLDSRQLAAVTACALLLVFGVFSLGVIIGRKAASIDVAVETAGDLAALDAQARKDRPPASVPAKATAETTLVPSPPRAATVVAPPLRTVQAATPAAPLSPPPRDLGDYTVQIGASQERAEAARLEGRARGAGLKPYVAEANLGSRGTWYRVRVGAFRDKEAANHFRKDVERELRIPAAVMPAH